MWGGSSLPSIKSAQTSLNAIATLLDIKDNFTDITYRIARNIDVELNLTVGEIRQILIYLYYRQCMLPCLINIVYGGISPNIMTTNISSYMVYWLL